MLGKGPGMPAQYLKNTHTKHTCNIPGQPLPQAEGQLPLAAEHGLASLLSYAPEPEEPTSLWRNCDSLGKGMKVSSKF